MPNTTTTANYQQDWEREAAFQLWEVNRNDGFSAGAAMKIHGSASARLNRKALRLNFKGSLGYQELSYPLLNPEITESFDAFLIRASGQDAHHLQFRDAIGQVFFKNQDVGSTDFRPIVLFMNGEYWGIHNLRERSDEDFIARYYEADVDEMDCLENRGVANPEERVGTRTRYMEMLSYAKNNDLDVETNYQTLSTMMDMDNFINYYIAQVFVANSDWPAYNVRMWRHKTEVDNPGVFYQENLNNRYLDGRYRWILFDLDQSLGRFHNANTNTLQAASAVGTWNDNFFVLFRKLVGATTSTGAPATDTNGLYSNGSSVFRREFINRFCDALNTYLLPDRTTSLVTQTQNIYAPFMSEHIQRWGLPSDVTTWNTIATGVRSFLTSRPASIRTHLTNKFQLTNGTATLQLSINNSAMGFVRLNSISLGSNTGFEPLPFSGVYFKDVPISLTAIANPGYRFVGFTGIDSEDASVTLNLTGNTSIEAVFEVEEEDFAGDTLNPEPHNLNMGPFSMLGFASDSPAGTFPPNSRILMSANSDPNILAEMNLLYTSPYNLTSRTRVEASGGGLAFINTGNPTSDGTTSGYLGALVIGLKSTGQTGLKVNFNAETQEVNTRIYGIALQYRIGTEGAWSDVMVDGNPVRYIRDTVSGHKQTFFAIPLPSETENQPYLQLRWKYYYISGGSGARAKLRIDDIFVYSDSYSATSGIKVNEIMASNVAWEHPSALDEFGDRSDWVELYNCTSEPLNLKGCYLSDSQNTPGKWMFPSVTIQGYSHLLIRASNRDLQAAGANLHTNFAVSSSGEPIILSDINGTVVDFVDAFPIPADNSYGRMPDGSENLQVLSIPSPGMGNLIIQAPSNVTVSLQSGIFQISWEAVEYANTYKIYAADEPDATIWEELETVNTPAWQCAEGDLAQKKFYKITAMP